MTMLDAQATMPTYIIGDGGNILEAREEADLVRTGILIGYTSLMLEVARVAWRKGTNY